MESEDESEPGTVVKKSGVRKDELKEVEKPLPKKVSQPCAREESRSKKPMVSSAQKAALEAEDDEISRLEKKLGIKKSKSKGVGDGLDDLLNGIDSIMGVGDSKRKREDAEWLDRKRRRVVDDDGWEVDDGLEGGSEDDLSGSGLENGDDSDDAEISDEDVDIAGEDSDDEEDLDKDQNDDDAIDNPFSSDDSDPFDEADSSPSTPPPPPPTRKPRENPYIAPISPSSSTTTKYIPPHLRAAPASTSETLLRLRRQLQGLLNRLSESNMPTILRDVQALYATNARQHVSDTVIDLLIDVLADRTTLLDSFIILHAAFLAALFRTVGTQFGAQLLERVVGEFDRYYADGAEGGGKEPANLISLLATLYIFQVCTSAIVYDYIRLLLSSLTELNTELLLKVIRTCGPQLRQDDPRALKDIGILLQKQVAVKGEDTLSVRTKFMVETITNLKNNRIRGNATSAVATEHIVRMKKTLGGLKGARASEPLGIGLQDIRDAEKGGKWWLVGASWKASSSDAKTQKQDIQPDDEADPENIDLVSLARQHRMNTDVRRAIFVAVMGAEDVQDAQNRLHKARLSKSQELEIPPVLLYVSGAEPAYNRFYTVLAKKLCSDHKFRKAFEFRLWGLFRRMGEKDRVNEDEDDDDVEDGSGEMSLRQIVTFGTMYAELVSSGSLPITVLKVCTTLFFLMYTADCIRPTRSSTLHTSSRRQLHSWRCCSSMCSRILQRKQRPTAQKRQLSTSSPRRKMHPVWRQGCSSF